MKSNQRLITLLCVGMLFLAILYEGAISARTQELFNLKALASRGYIQLNQNVDFRNKAVPQFGVGRNQPKINLNVKEQSLTKWDSQEGISFRQVPGANLGATSFEVMDDNRIAFLCNSTSEIIVVNQASGQTIKKIDVSSTPRDFSYSDGYFFVLTESQVIQYDESGNGVNAFSFPQSHAGVERLARFNNATYLLLPSGNSLMIESNGRSIETSEREGWITRAGHFVATRLNGNNSYSIKITTGDGKSYERVLTTDEKVAGVYVVGSTNSRVVLDVQTFISEDPISVERSLSVVELNTNGLGPIVANTKVPDSYYVLSNKDFSLIEDGTIFNMVTTPQGVFVFSLAETMSGTVQGYPQPIVETKHHFNDHLIQIDGDGRGEEKSSSKVEEKSSIIGSALITRNQIINNAIPYTSITWTATSSNKWNGLSCGGKTIQTPSWVQIGSNTSMPYCWGGGTTTTSLQSYLNSGKSAGDNNTETTFGAEPSCAVGLDCSGFVTRAWGLSEHHLGTGQLPDISTSVNLSQTQPGDIVNIVGSHTRLIETNYGNGTYRVIESSGTDWKTAYHTYTSAQLSSYNPRQYNNVSGGDALPGSFALTLTPECSGTTSQIRLNWTTSSGATTYDVYRNGSLYSAGAGLTGTQFINSGNISVGTSYSYFVQAKNSAGSTNSNTQSATAPDCIISTPTITVSTTSLSSFGNVAVGQNSAPQSYTVSGSNLSANITIQAPTGFQISLSSTSGFTNTLTRTPSGGSVPTTTIYARFSPQASGAQTGSISHTSSGATAKNVSVSGTGTSGGCSSTSINVGQTLNGSLTSSDCVLSGTSRRYDVYSFNGQAGQGIAASMDSSAFDTYLYLTNSANQVLDEDNNSGPGTNSRIPNSSGFFTLPATGSYFLWASSASDNATGAYSVSLSGCTYSLSSSENEVGPGNGGGSFQMEAPSGCGWSAVSDSTSWLTTSSSGSGDGTVRYDFTANTSTSPRTGRITVGGQVSTITQIGLGGAGNVRFSSATYSSNEGGADVTITVTRAGGTGFGSVQYSTSNGTATAGSDYVSASGTLLFGGNETSKSFTITILDDTTLEGSETINLSLNNNSSSFTLGNPSTATLTIIDNDVSPDSTGPGLSINSHNNGDTVSNSSISLSGTASDSGRGDNGISSVTVNGVAASGGTASGSGTANWNHTLTLNQGANNVTVVARDNSSNQNTTTQSITLHYQPAQTYTIAVSASPSSGGTVGGGGTFVAGGSRTVTASANSGYSFANWTENGGVVSSSASYTFTLNGNRTLVANFSIVSSGNAAYDSTLKAPKCPVPGSVCDSGTLINGRGNITGGAEPNQPNTIYNSCADNTVGSYHSDESIDKIRISTLDGSSFAPGKTVKIEVTVWAVSTTDDFLDLFFAADAANPNWDYITSLTPSVTGAQVLSTTFTLPPGGSLQAVRANFLYKGELSTCSSGSDSFEDHDDLVFAVGSGATQSIQLLLEEIGPSPSQAAAVDSLLLSRDPFPVVNEANLFNLGLDRNTRVIIFATNLQLTQGETSSSVVVNLIDSSGLSYDIAAEDVRPIPNFNFTQVIFRLPNNLPVGTCTIKVIAHGQVSNAGTIRIRN